MAFNHIPWGVVNNFPLVDFLALGKIQRFFLFICGDSIEPNEEQESRKIGWF